MSPSEALLTTGSQKGPHLEMPSQHDRVMIEMPTHCPYCALQCGMTVGGTPVTITPRHDVPANQGGLCQKGWTAADLLSSPERLTTPLRRAPPGAPPPPRPPADAPPHAPPPRRPA